MVVSEKIGMPRVVLSELSTTGVGTLEWLRNTISIYSGVYIRLNTQLIISPRLSIVVTVLCVVH